MDVRDERDEQRGELQVNEGVMPGGRVGVEASDPQHCLRLLSLGEVRRVLLAEGGREQQTASGQADPHEVHSILTLQLDRRVHQTHQSLRRRGVR